MALKIENLSVDIDLDLTASGLGVIEAKNKPNAKEFLKWAKELEEKQEEMLKDKKPDPEKQFSDIICHMDYWYGKGADFWLDNLSVPAILNIIESISKELNDLQKK